MTTEHLEESEDSRRFLLKITADIVSSYLQANRLDPDQIDPTIRKIYQTLISLKNDEAGYGGRVPAVPIEDSITPDYLICLEDGEKFKLLKRHLRTNHNMTPKDYRKKWGLPPDYPMVAPNYAKKRRRLAKENGLGLKDAAE